MPVFKQRMPWARQPQTPVGIDWSNPLTRGLQVVWLPQTSSLQKNVKTPGVGIVTNGTSDYAFAPCAWKYGDGVSIAAFADCNWRSATTYERLAAVRTGTTSTGFQLMDDGTKKIQVFVNAKLSTNGYQTFTLPASYQSGSHLFVGTTQFSRSSCLAYVDGIALTGGTVGGVDSSSLDTGASGVDISRIQYDGIFYYGRYNWIGLVVAWNRALTPLEVKLLSDNPWQIFSP